MEKVMCNIDILDNILQYLKFRRILKLKLVCSKLNEVIRRCPNFLGRAKGIIIAFRENGLVTTPGSPLYRAIRLEEGGDLFPQLQNILSSGRELHPDICSWDHVRALHMRYVTLANIDFHNYGGLNSVSVFQRLQELKFCTAVNVNEVANNENESLKVMKNLAWLSLTCASLTSFHLADFSMPKISDSTLAEYTVAVTRFLELNAKHLKSLMIGDQRIWRLPILAHIRMPRLKICFINAPDATEYLTEFLNNHLLLTELAIDKIDLNDDILNVFRRRENCLKSLKLHCYTERGVGLRNFNWAFLKEYKMLETFSLTAKANLFYDTILSPHSSFGCGFSEYLPAECLKKISIGIHNIRDDHALYETLVTKSYLKLSSLEIYGAGNRITNANLQIIFQHMTYLQKLKLENCKDITDYGITGISPSFITQSNVSNLRALTVLHITKCPKLTFAIKECIVFQNLQKLCIGNFVNEPNWVGPCMEEHVKTLILQNPFLEVLTLQENWPDVHNLPDSELQINDIKKVVATLSKNFCVMEFAPFFNRYQNHCGI